MKGFFPGVQIVSRKPLSLIPACGECGLYRSCRSPKMKVWGKGRKGILVVGESPGKAEDREGRPFVEYTSTGELLREALAAGGVNLDRDCWTTNALICKGPQFLNSKLIEHCRPNIIKTIGELKPRTIILLGVPAVKSVLGWVYREDVGIPSRWDGWAIPSQQLNAWICPTWHPEYILRNREEHSKRLKGGRYASREPEPIQKCFWEPHLKAACGLSGRPWETVPDYRSQVRIVLDPAKAARTIRRMAEGGTPVAFDYETNRLKPDGSGAFIWTCALSDGTTTIAYPWQGEAIEATKAFLVSEVPKIAANAKFESRWSRKILGVWPRNWVWDTMLAAHVLDNRPSITSLEFQAFVLLGQPPWDRFATPYLRTGGGSNEDNRIKEAPLDKLLEYNGMDALLEWHVAMKQSQRMGVKLWG